MVVAIAAILATICSMVEPAPLSWRDLSTASSQNTTEPIPVSTIPWEGRAHISGAYLLSRINLNFINSTCTKFKSDLDVATQVARVLTNTQLNGATTNNIRRYGFSILTLETKFKEVLEYITALLLCSGRGGELWQAHSAFKQQTTAVWRMLQKAAPVGRDLTNQFPNRRRVPKQGSSTTGAEILNKLIHSHPTTKQPQTSDTSHDSSHTPIVNPVLPLNDMPNSLINESNIMTLLEAARPALQAEKRSPILVGLGLGFLGNYLLGQYFGDNNDAEIERLNRNIQRQNKQLLITNRRIDIISKNISSSVNTIKKILDKMLEAQQTADIHYAIQWNLDQLASSIKEVNQIFKFGELSVTLLQKGILNAELINIKSLETTIAEGLQSFPNMIFPLKISRYQLKHIVSILKIQHVGHLKYLMIIPLTRQQEYKVTTLIPHPVKVGPSYLVLPKMKEVLLKNNLNYITTTKTNMYSLSTTNHIMLELEPVYNINRPSCEIEGYKGNTTAMLELCDYTKVGQVSDVFVTETNKERIVHFSKLTKVLLDCPEKQVRDSMIGLHKLPLACDIQTDTVFWPAKQTVTVNLELNDSFVLDSSYLPIISINKTDTVIHRSLRDLISKLPKENELFTIDFPYHDLTLEEVQSLSIYTHSITTIIIIINSVLIIFLWKRQSNSVLHRNPSVSSYAKSKFRGIRDSINFRKNRIHRSDSLRSARDSIRSKGRTLRDSIRSRGSTIKEHLKQAVPISPKVIRRRERRKSSSKSPSRATAETNTDWQLPPYAPPPKAYPILPRYA